MKIRLAILITLAAISYSRIADSRTALGYKSWLKNWGLVNTGGVDIRAVRAWNTTEGSRSVVVAVIDTGVDVSHRDLKANIWRDPASSSTYGWNFVVDQPNPTDEHGHGTHIAGIIGSIADSKNGVSGVAHRVSIMPVKYYSDANPGQVNLRNTIEAINYAVRNGAQIINYSGGGPEFSEEEYIELKKAEARGVLVVSAAGNEHQDSDQSENYYYPAAYHLSNIISVTAVDVQGNMLPSSNWGKNKVDLAAPGENIYSTLPGGRYGYMTGTSQATAFVSGVAALLLACNPDLTPQQIKHIIVTSVTKTQNLTNITSSGGILNAANAVKLGCRK